MRGKAPQKGAVHLGQFAIVALCAEARDDALPTAAVFAALRRSIVHPDAVERAMCAHYVARACCASEAAACAAAPPPGGTVAYRDWRDRACGAAVERCLRALAAAVDDAQLPQLATEACNAARNRALAAASSTHLVGRWRSHAEAEAFLGAAACAAAAAACAASADPAYKQHALDVIDVVMSAGMDARLGVEPQNSALAAFCDVHDALVAAMHNDPVDAHPAPTLITTSDGRPIVAKRAVAEPMQKANRLRWQILARLRMALAAGSVAPAQLLFETRPGLLPAVDFVPRAYGDEAPAPRQFELPASSPVLPPIAPHYVRQFPRFTVAYPGAKRRHDMAICITAPAAAGRCSTAIGPVFEISPPLRMRGLLPLGTQIFATFWERGLRVVADTHRIKVRIDSVGRLATMSCSPVPEPQTEHCTFVTFGRTGAHAVLCADSGGLMDAMYLFLPPSSVL